ncbi:hypothetical protein ACGFZA_39075 [Streptomyces sp. NPDC048211]|uniref:hypothetical protein n=1 Tax=Streptomyces sp. NPDC048211 TaxID=3365516 RepID=UPI003721F252
MGTIEPDDRQVTAIRDADSVSWSVRASAGRRLAASAELTGLTRVLHRLLLDNQDTGVIRETAEALLARGDVSGLRTVLAALARAASADALDQLSAAVDCNPLWTTVEGTARLVEQLQGLVADVDEGVRNEALKILEPILKSRD